ncbi:MAG: UvrD-helicase domain-containing protein [Syntrophomonadaceae bacterium]|nr:UvrD-helicase domain-containing protein [Syntrophomonadaceae bacterium]
MQWTPQQTEAIQTRGCNLLVAAAAGAGKTSVLVERIITQLKDPAPAMDVDRLLVVTFTNAAAAQMREKIGRELENELKRNPASQHLRRQLNLLNCASISTLHSFCLEILRQHFYRLDLDPNFRVADDEEVSLLQLEVIEERLEEWYRSSGPGATFLTLVDSYGGERDDTGLISLILNLYRFARSHPWPEHWLKQAAAVFTLANAGNLDTFPWCTELKQSLADQLKGCLEDLETMIRWCHQPQAPQIYLENLYAERDMIQGLWQACKGTWEEIFERFQTVHFGRLKACRKSDKLDPLLQEQVKLRRDKTKKLVGELGGAYFSRTPKAHLEDLQSLAPLMQNLVELVIDFGRSYQREKNIQGIVDFGDLEQYCLQILLQPGTPPGQLIPSAVAHDLRERYSEVLVDEYQDINQVQEAILQLVSRSDQDKPNLFMVGDVKQSIYRFRLAEPGLFLEKYHRYSSVPDNPSRRINLKENFRSSASIVEGINYFFRQIMTAGVGEIAYDAEAELVCGQKFLARTETAAGEEAAEEMKTTQLKVGYQLAPEIEINLIDRGKEEESVNQSQTEESASDEREEEEIEQLETAELEARWIARQFKSLVEEGKYLWDQKAGTYRPIRYCDLVVLLRTTRGLANIFLEEFRQAGIPAYADLGTGYFAAGEVETMIALLQIIDNPQQDIPLVTVLRSPLVGLSAEELAQVRLCQRESGFYQATIAAATELTGETGDKVRSFLDQLEKWRTLARRDRLSTLLWVLIYPTGFYDYVGGMQGGTQRQANLRLFQTWAGKYETTIFRGLFNFLRFVEKLRERGGDMGSARTLTENEDVVRIMSIHKSKGLEFPVVCVAGLGRRFNLADLNKTVLFHKEIGLGPQLVDPDRSLQYPTLATLALKQRIRRETLAEEMRLLYVAMTRTQEKLYLVGTVNDLVSSARTWCEAAPSEGMALLESRLARASNYLDWIGPSLIRHPQGQFLARIAGYPDQPQLEVNDEISLQVQVVSPGEAGTVVGSRAEETGLPLVQMQAGVPKETPMLAEIERRLSWKYTDQALVGKKAKFTVTEMKRLSWSLPEDETAFTELNFIQQPRFTQKTKGLTAAERGSAIHIVLQHVNLRRSLDRESIQQQVLELVEKEILTPEQAVAIELEPIVNFFRGHLGQRLLQARDVYREVSFSLALPASQLYPELKEGREKVIVQGVIDCLADEGDGFLLLDYKTDWLGLALTRLEELSQRYQSQLRLYSQAVETILKRPVREKYLYFLTHGIAKRID